MSFPIKTCAICSDEFELRPDKPGFANRCPTCSEPDAIDPLTNRPLDPLGAKADSGLNEARRQAMRELLYRKDS